jgi:hypothetical protein
MGEIITLMASMNNLLLQFHWISGSGICVPISCLQRAQIYSILAIDSAVNQLEF